MNEGKKKDRKKTQMRDAIFQIVRYTEFSKVTKFNDR